jgi:ankyrin repeat protein
VTFLLDLGADVEAVTQKGATPLHVAVMFGKFDVAEALLRVGKVRTRA